MKPSHVTCAIWYVLDVVEYEVLNHVYQINRFMTTSSLHICTSKFDKASNYKIPTSSQQPIFTAEQIIFKRPNKAYSSDNRQLTRQGKFQSNEIIKLCIMHFINDKANGRGSVLGIFTIHYTCTVLHATPLQLYSRAASSWWCTYCTL